MVSATVTSSGSRPSTLEATRWTIGLDLAAGQHGAAGGLDQDRGARVHVVAGEQVVLGHHEVHGGDVDGVDRGDGLGQLALHRPLEVDPLAELARW